MQNAKMQKQIRGFSKEDIKSLGFSKRGQKTSIIARVFKNLDEKQNFPALTKEFINNL